jgi:peptidoglycan/xylan/chitin deacetylase (PgdA/CDA1 family)
MSATPGPRPSFSKFAIRTVKLGISFIYFLVDWGGRGLLRLIGKNFPGTCVVLYYHSVPDRYRRRFEQQMTVLVRTAHLIDLRNITELPANDHSAAITFDDALESFVRNVVPLLVCLNIPVTVFAVADALDGRPDWAKGYYLPDERVMSAESLRHLPEWVTVGSHSLTHANLVTSDADAVAQEIICSREKLELLLDRPVSLFSFPFGVFDDNSIRRCREAGYSRVFTTEPSLFRAADNDFVVGRIAADPWDWWLEFHLKIRGAYCWQSHSRTVLRNFRRGLTGNPIGRSWEKRKQPCERTENGESVELFNIC